VIKRPEARKPLPMRPLIAASPVAGGAREPVAARAPIPPSPPDLVSHFIELEMEARQCADLDALRFSIVNSTRRIAGFEQAFLVEPEAAGGFVITRATSVSAVDHNAPLVRTIARWLAHPSHLDLLARGEPREANIEAERIAWGLPGEAIVLAHAYWLPLKSRDGSILAGLLALRRESWRPQSLALLMPLAGAYGHAWEALLPGTTPMLARARRTLSARRLLIALGGLASVAAVLPVPMSVLAPAEIVGSEPVLVTAPIDGVIGEVLAPPGAFVQKGSPILRFVDVKLRNDVEVAARNVAVAEARHFKTVQSATAAQKDAHELATARAEVAVARSELAYASEMLSRAEIRAQTAGLLIYSAKSDWVGRPVATGERIMEIADPAKPEIRIEIPVSDAIALEAGNNVMLFLDGDPLRPIVARVTRTSYRPALSAEQQLVFKVHARFAGEQAYRIGLRGVARVSGGDVALWFYLLRRPIAAVRQRVGL
jgi:multidrug efflux pump subunit AcrA (membrane-fusion protein)